MHIAYKRERTVRELQLCPSLIHLSAFSIFSVEADVGGAHVWGDNYRGDGLTCRKTVVIGAIPLFA